MMICSKCNKTPTDPSRPKYCGDGSDKDNEHRWVDSLPVIKAETVVITKKTTTTTISIGQSQLLNLIADAVELATKIRPVLSDIEFDSDMGSVDNVTVTIKTTQVEES